MKPNIFQTRQHRVDLANLVLVVIMLMTLVNMFNLMR